MPGVLEATLLGVPELHPSCCGILLRCFFATSGLTISIAADVAIERDLDAASEQLLTTPLNVILWFWQPQRLAKLIQLHRRILRALSV